MKKVIYGYHTTDSGKGIYFWEVNEDVYEFQLKDCTHAIVDTSRGLQLIRVCGYGYMQDYCKLAYKKAIMLVKLEKE